MGDWQVQFVRQFVADLKNSPLNFALWALVWLVIGGSVSWFFKGQIVAERLALQDSAIVGYRQRLGEVPKENALVRLSNQDLRLEANRLASEMRQLQQRISEARGRALSQRKSFNDEMRALSEQQAQANIEFAERFQSRASQLWLEIRRRLPPLEPPGELWGMSDRQIEAALSQGVLTGPNPVGSLAAEIERLAAMLPK